MASTQAEFEKRQERPFRAFLKAGEPTSPRRGFTTAVVILMGLALAGCGVLNLGKWKGLEKTGKDEQFYLLKNIMLTSGSTHSGRDMFDHTMHDVVNLVFVPRNETNTYTAESIWYDPAGIEFRTIRRTYDKQRENKKGDERESSGTIRIQSMPVADMYNHKKGIWSVALYLDGKLARRLNFTVR